jgi:tRNA 2-thiouridine synthesizing protein A
VPEDEAPALEVDALGLLCPLPIVRTKAALRRVATGALVVLWADDDAIELDLPAWCAGDGPELCAMERATHPTGRAAWRCVVRRR